MMAGRKGSGRRGAGQRGGWVVRLAGAVLAGVLAGTLGLAAAWADGPTPQGQCPPGLVPSATSTSVCVQPWIWPDDRPFP
jgi:hypothetical protein